VLVNLTLDRESCKLLEDPEIITRGFIHNQAGDELMDAARQMIKGAVRNADGDLQGDLQQAVKSFLFNKTRRRPTVFVTLSKS
jgi:ribonuclease J